VSGSTQPRGEYFMALAPLDKCTVTGPVLKPDGTPCYPGSVVFTLSKRDRDGDITIMPAPVDVDIDSDGNISADLWPNADGYAGTVYTAAVWSGKRGTPRTAYPSFKVVVPDADTANLAEIMDLSPPDSVDDATAAKIAAQGYATSAHNDAAQTAADRAVVEPVAEDAAAIAPHIDAVVAVNGIASEVEALAAITGAITTAADNIDAIIAAPAQAAAAAGSAVAAAVSASAAGNSEENAAASKDAAADSASAAATSATDAAASKDAAATSETNSANSATASAASASAAATSETNAGDSAVASAASASAAATSEANAGGSADAAAGSASAAATSETNAGNSATASAASASAAATSEDNAAASATAAAGSATSAATSAALEDYGVAIYSDTAIGTGGYIASIGTRVATVQSDLHAQLVGDDGAEADFYLSIDGALTYGPVRVEAGTPVHLSGLSISYPKDKEVDVVVSYLSGTATDLIVETYGAAA
jgi:hypothetical protein